MCQDHRERGGAAVASGPLSLARPSLLCRVLARLAGGSVRPNVVGHGTAEPIARNDTESGRAQNRRVVVTVTHPMRRLR